MRIHWEAIMNSSKETIRDLVEKCEAVLFSDYEEASCLAEHLLFLSIKHKDTYGLYKSHNLLGIIQSDQGNTNEAMEHFLIAMSYTDSEKTKYEKPVLLNNIGTLLLVTRDYNEAIENFNSALAMIFETHKKESLLSSLYLNIADAYLSIHQPAEAMEVLEKAKAHLPEDNDEDRAVYYGSLSQTLLELNQFEKAYEAILLCEEYAVKSKYLVIVNMIHYYKAKYFELTQNYYDAQLFYERALALQTEEQSLYYFRQISLDYIQFLLKRNKYELAIPHIMDALKKAEIHQWHKEVSDYYRLLSKCYVALRMWDEATQAMNRYFEIEEDNKKVREKQNHNVMKIQEKVLQVRVENQMLSDSVLKLKTVNYILRQINISDDMVSLIRILYDALNALFKIDTFGIALYNDAEHKIDYVSRYENGVSLGPKSVGYDQDKSLSVWVYENKKPLIIKNSEDLNAINSEYNYVKNSVDDYIQIGNASKSLVIWPLLIESRNIGLINLQAMDADAYSTFDYELIEMIAAHMAIAIENYRQKAELSDAVERLNRLSYIDSLTNIYNRQALNEYLPQLYEQAIEMKSHMVFAMIDLDNFKNLNDQFGHQKGDECLATFANLLKAIIGDLGHIYRYGGDEFSILFVGIDLDVVERLLYEIIEKSANFYTMSPTLIITASIGAIFVENGDCKDISLNSFINYADNALYISKNEGKNTYRKVVL